jgi:flagellin
MASYINTNLASLNSQRNLSMSSSSLTTALQRLSSGLRINSAKDDAAGLAISQRMAGQIGGLTQAARNANDAISLAQTAEGALSGMSDNLQRLRTLAVQSANSTNSDSDRAAIQSEVSSLVAEIGRVAGTTQFNGINLLDGSFKAQAFQIGANANQTIAVSMDSAQTSKLGSSQAASLTASNNGTAMGGGDITLNGVSVGASSAASDTASTGGKSASAIAKAAAFNAVSSQTGVTATVNSNVVTGVAMTNTASAGTLVINGVTTATITTGGAATDGTANRLAVITAINAISGRTGVVATDTGTSATGIVLTAADGRNISLSTSFLDSATTGVTSSGTKYGTFTLSSSKEIDVTGTATNLKNAGVTAGSYATQTAYASTTAGSSTGFAAGDFKLNGVIIGATLTSYDTASTADNDKSAISKAAAINAVSSQTGVSASANATNLDGVGMTLTQSSGTMVINGVTTATIALGGTDATADRAAVVNAINAVSGRTGVKAVDGGTSASGVSLVAADGRNISVSTSFLDSAETGVSSSGTHYGTFTLTSSKSFTVDYGTTGAQMSTIGMLAAGTYGAGKSGQSLDSVDVSTAAGANDAIVAIDNAISSINSSRANLGAIQSRFTSTINTLQSTSENLTAAKSRITDADFAAETANLTRGQILQQAGTAMLAQANALPNGILALLR